MLRILRQYSTHIRFSDFTTLKKLKSYASQPLPDFQRNLALNLNNLTPSIRQKTVIDNANLTYRSLTILLAKRIETLFVLNYITLLNPNIAKIVNAYIDSYAMLTNTVLTISTPEDNIHFVEILQQIMDLHTDNIIILRDGIKECLQRDKNSFPDQHTFLNNHLSERILLRLITNNHLLVSKEGHGVLDDSVNVLDVLNNSIHFINNLTEIKYYEKVPTQITTLQQDPNNPNIYNPSTHISFPYFSNHLEYIINEILKNSARSTIENNKLSHPIKILVVHTTTPQQTLQIKISDMGGGVHPSNMPHLWEYAFTTVSANNALTSSVKDTQLGATTDLGIDTNEVVADNIVAGMGYGLPLSLTYAKLFGGDIKLTSVYGKGTDVYIHLKQITHS